MKIYLAGKIPKGDEIGRIPDWRAEYIAHLSTSRHYSFLSPEDPSLDESKPMQVVGHDCSLVKQADLLIIDAREKLGVGTAQEMVIAKYLGKLVFVVLPKGSHHRRENLNMHGRVVRDWIHPFISCFADRIFESVDALSRYCEKHFDEIETLTPKTMSVFEDAIREYMDSKHSKSTRV